MQSLNVLVVDDDPMVCSIVSDTIGSAGFGVEYLPTVESCLRRIDDTAGGEAPAAVLLDIFMPKADGFELMRELANRKCRLPLIVMTGVGEEYLRVASEFGRAWGLTVLDTLAKPLAHERLRANLETIRGKIAANSAARKIVILIVDDDPDVRAVPAAILGRSGFDTIEAASGLEALDLIRAEAHIDVLFTDIDMPGMNGIELALAAERLRPNLRIIFTSGKIDAPPLAHSLFVAKPYRARELAATITALLAH